MSRRRLQALVVGLGAGVLLSPTPTKAEPDADVVWSCSPFESAGPQPGKVLAQMSVTRKRTVIAPPSRAYLFDSRVWTVRDDGTMELDMRRQATPERPLGARVPYHCVGHYRGKMLERFLAAVKASALCEKTSWIFTEAPAHWGKVHYSLHVEAGPRGCATEILGWPYWLPKRVASVIWAWDALEQSVCGVCHVPEIDAFTGAHDVPDYRAEIRR